MTLNQAHGGIIADQDGFGPAALGGRVNVKFASVTFEDTTAKALFTLPQGAEIVDWQVNVTTAFNGSGTDLLDIGKAGDGDAFANDLNVATATQLKTGFVPSAMFTPLAEDTTVTATFAQSVADADAGEAVVACFYILR